jgi:hypothetical protein
VNTIALPWETWRAVIAVLRASGLPYKRDHAEYLERHLEQHGPDEATVRLSLTDDVLLRSSTRTLAAGDPAAGGGVSASDPFPRARCTRRESADRHSAGVGPASTLTRPQLKLT